MGKNRKFIENRVFPDTDEIARRKDFTQVMNKHGIAKKMLLKKYLTWGGIGLASVIIVAGVVLLNPATNTSPELPDTESFVTVSNGTINRIISPPLPGKEIPFTKYKINPKKDNTLIHHHKTTIQIPANAFPTQQQPSSITDSVEIWYREYRTVEELFRSGIPMTYDSGGIRYTFESAGMLEIQFRQSGQQLLLQPQKPVIVEMQETSNKDNYSLYYLDTIHGQWLPQKQHTIETSAEKTTHHSNYNPPSDQISYITPKLADNEKYQFNIAFDKNRFPELAIYENMLFEVIDNAFNSRYFDIHWDKILLNPTQKQGIYTVSLKKSDSTIHTIVIPVFETADYSNAKKQFETAVKTQQLEQLKTNTRQQEKINIVNKKVNELSPDELNKTIRQLNSTTRKFVIPQGGIYNYDFPILRDTQKLVQLMVETKKQHIEYETIYLAEKGRTAIFSFNKNEPLQFNQKAENLIWTITREGQFAFFNSLPNTNIEKLSAIKIISVENGLNEIKTFTTQ